jgi:hypothetical protein
MALDGIFICLIVLNAGNFPYFCSPYFENSVNHFRELKQLTGTP